MISLTEIDKAYSEHSKEIFSYILRFVHDHDMAEDLLQDVFIKLINYSVKSGVNAANIRALLYTIAGSVYIDSARKTKKVTFGSDDISKLPDDHIQKDGDSSAVMMDAVDSLIDSLGEPEKSIIMYKRNGLTYPEIAQVMKISERTLKRKVKSIITDMRKNLKNEGFFIYDVTESGDGSLNI